MKTVKKKEPKKFYYFEENDGHFYVYYAQTAPVLTLFDVVGNEEEAKKAIEDHKEGKHSTQEIYGK